MRFLADMGVARRVVDWLRQQGHDASHLLDEGLERLPNGQIFAKAAAEQRIVITFDLGFGEIVALSGGQVVSVVLLRLHNTTTPHVIERLSHVLAATKGALDSGAVVVVEELRHRVRKLPIGR